MVLVAYQGERGAYSEEALQLFFEARGMRATEAVPCATMEEAIQKAETGEAHYAFLPIENTMEGTVDEAMDLVLASDLFVVGEMRHKIDHCLIGHPGATLGSVKVAYSHPYAIRQSKEWLRAHQIEARPTTDTAGAVREVKQRGNILEAAIGSARSAEVHGMQVLQRSIQSREHNSTRFWALSKNEYRPNPARKETFLTSISFGVRHQAGALYDILGEFAKRQVNLTKVESRPRPERPWHYEFQVDLEGHREDNVVREALGSLIAKASSLKVLGSYPTWDSVLAGKQGR
ncbi:MAG TPA: prephenate dehydratase [Candidatus Thermoplasmatota archaeon]|nr:prephenate dehydratase [Candidatus Thermoplasmatota archaeon]